MKSAISPFMKRGENMEKKLHNVKIIGDGKQHRIIIDDKDESYGILEATLKIEPCTNAKVELLMKSDVEINSIELQAEVATKIEKPKKNLYVEWKKGNETDYTWLSGIEQSDIASYEGIIYFKDKLAISLNNFIAYEFREV